MNGIFEIKTGKQSEQYEEANHIKREIILQLQPSQRAQRELERQQVRHMLSTKSLCACIAKAYPYHTHTQVVDMERQLNTAGLQSLLFFKLL